MDNKNDQEKNLLEEYLRYEKEDQEKLLKVMKTLVPHPKIASFEIPDSDSQDS